MWYMDNGKVIMNRQELIDREVEQLNKLSKDYFQNVESTLSDIRKDKVKLWLSPVDKYRLLTLRSWEIKYRISTRIILLVLLPFWEAFVQRRSKKMKSRGLNVRVSTLVGKKSELILKDQLSKLYPNKENVLLWSQNERERITQLYLKRKSRKSDDGVRSRSDPSSMYTANGKEKTLLDFSSPAKYVSYYQKLIKREQLSREEIEDVMKKYSYRGNPFRTESL